MVIRWGKSYRIIKHLRENLSQGDRVKCSSCGKDNRDNAIFCENCGVFVIDPVRLDDHRLDGPKRAIRSAIMARASTDRLLNPLWVIVALIVSIGGYVIGFAILLTAFPSFSFTAFSVSTAVIYGGQIASLIIYTMLTYYVVKREGEHAKREWALRQGVMSLVSAAAGSQQRQYWIGRELGAMSYSSQVEKHRNPLVWSFFIAMPLLLYMVIILGPVLSFNIDISGIEWFFVGVTILAVVLGISSFVLQIYLLYFLSKNIGLHHARWNSFAYNSRFALSRMGYPPGKPFVGISLPERSMVLYIILGVFVPFFLIYWWWTVLKDPNEHYRAQWEYEDNIWSVL